MISSLNLSMVRRFLPRQRHPRPFEELDNLSMDAALKEEMRAFVTDLAERMKGRKPPSPNPMILVRAPRGSGKTCFVRALTSALYRLGALCKEKPLEIDFSDLRADYIGYGRIKALAQCNAALDGVLSIDDLYLFQGERGQEALEAIRSFAAENQRRIVVFFKNTPWRADQFFEACPHLNPAFGRVDLPALKPAQLWDIFRRHAARRWILLADGAEALVMPELERRVSERVWPRGRWAGGREMDCLFERALGLATERVRKASEDTLVLELQLVDIANALAETAFDRW